MKIPLVLLAIVALASFLLLKLAPPPAPQETLLQRTDLPWQITVNPDGSSRVFDLELGSADLVDAQNKFGRVEHYAVFERDLDHSELEAYFGNVMFGPLQAKVVISLKASEAQRRALMQQAKKRESSPTGDWKYLLQHQVEDQLRDHKVEAISYVPATRGLDRAFFLQRFGEPSAVLQENENAVSWFYPDKGLSILIDEQGREVLEYQPPRDFVLPAGVSPYSAPAG